MAPKLRWTRVRPGLYTTTLPDGREAEVRAQDHSAYIGTGYSGNEWQLIVDESWWTTLPTKRECQDALENEL